MGGRSVLGGRLDARRATSTARGRDDVSRRRAMVFGSCVSTCLPARAVRRGDGRYRYVVPLRAPPRRSCVARQMLVLAAAVAWRARTRDRPDPAVLDRRDSPATPAPITRGPGEGRRQGFTLTHSRPARRGAPAPTRRRAAHPAAHV